MTKYISLLRGINVGGRNKVLMNDLKVLFENNGVLNVQNYIQSGNILFESDDISPIIFNAKISSAFQKQFGFTVPFITFPSCLIEKAIASNPFLNRYPEERLHLTFLAELPTNQSIDKLAKQSFSDEYFILDNLLFIACQGKYIATKLTNQFIEKQLNVSATTRNWKTVCKLNKLSKQEKQE